MDAARQILRFSIPGSILILLITGLVVLGELIQGVSLQAATAVMREDFAAVLALVASIPLGFLVYQVYYLGAGPFLAIPTRERLPRRDRGARVLRWLRQDQLDRIAANFELEDLDVKRTGAGARNDFLGEIFGVQELDPEYLASFQNPGTPSAVDAYDVRWRRNWDVLRTLLLLVTYDPRAGELKSEYVFLSDVYHSLGACRSACTLAWLASTIVAAVYVCDGHGNALSALISILAAAVICAALWALLNQTRRQTWKSAEKALGLGLRWLFNCHPELLSPRPSVED